MTHSSKYRFEQFAATRIYTPVVSYSPDGKQILHVNNATGQFNLWTIATGGGIPRQLTSFTDNTIRNAIWTPDGASILFQADQNGDEQHQLYRLGARGGWHVALTDKMDSQHNMGEVSSDGQWLAYSANDENPMHMDVSLLHLQSGEKRRIFTGRQAFAGEWSPNGRYMTVVEFLGNTDINVWLYDHETGETTICTPHDGDIVFVPVSWSPNNDGFYMMTNEGREFTNIAYYDIAKGSYDWYLTVDHDIENFAISDDGRVMIWAVNENGASKLYGKNLVTNESLTMPNLPIGVVGGISINPTGNKLALVYVRPSQAGNLYEVDLTTGDMLELGQSMLGGIDPQDFIEPEAVFYESFDGRKIPAWLYKPKMVDGMQYPLMLSIHGGPEAQERPMYNYNGLYQYLLNRGFGILAPNIRGSTGYGKSYQALIHRDWGGAELRDIEHAALYLRSLDWVDSNRLAVYGGSFGGFATLSAVTRLPQYWAVGVDIVGPSNLVTFAKAVPPFWRPTMKKWVGDPEEDYDMLMERSPITYVSQLRAPLLVIQGAKDPRVVQGESDQMVEKIRAQGGNVQYYVDEEEGHGATRRENSIKWMSMIARFLEEQLLDLPV